MKDYKSANIEIELGEVVLDKNAAIILAESSEVVVICVSLTSKYAEVAAYLGCGWAGDKHISGPGVSLEAGERTIHTDPDRKGQFTDIIFPDYVGWSCVTASIGRYDLIVTLLNDEKVFGA